MTIRSPWFARKEPTDDGRGRVAAVDGGHVLPETKRRASAAAGDSRVPKLQNGRGDNVVVRRVVAAAARDGRRLQYV